MGQTGFWVPMGIQDKINPKSVHLMQEASSIPPVPQNNPSARGLTSAEAEARLAQFGRNEPAATKRLGALAQFAAQFANPLVLILLIASAVSAYVGEFASASIVIGIVLVGTIVNFVQTFQSQRLIDTLRAGVAPQATVLRDGAWVEIPRQLIVPDDVIRLSAGDLVPADARLIAANDLHVHEAALTGESMPVEKCVSSDVAHESDQTNPPDKVFLGTSVVSGTATALVQATGLHTVFGEIASRLAARSPETEFERGTKQYSLFIMKTVIFLVLFVFLASIVLHRNPLESLLFAVALAVGLTPEFLPMIVAVTLARGAARMAQRKVIVKHLAAIQNFGSMDILCSDKTGTLTTGEMTLRAAYAPLGESSGPALEWAIVNSSFETGIKSPLDAAILREKSPDLSAYRKLDEIPFDFERRRLSVIVEHKGKRVLICKGAPEGVLGVCDQIEVGGKCEPLSTSLREQTEKVFYDLSAQGDRVLAVAIKTVESKNAYRASDEIGLTLVGYLAFADPLLEDIGDVVSDLHRDGVQIKILTGDSDLVARHVCSSVGLDAEKIVLGSEIDRLSDPALGKVAEQHTVFARLSPMQKNRVIMALKQRHHVVGYIGDGINDAPSLRAADVGISVAGAVDVAQDAADLILRERGLRVLHDGVLEGRRAFGNVMKYLLMGTSSNFGNMFSMAAATLFLPFLPLLPAQILLNNFLYDLAQITIPTDRVDRTFVRKPRRWDISLIRDFMIYLGPISSLFDFVTFGALWWLFQGSEEHFHTGWFVESLTTQTLVLFVIRTAGNPFQSRPSRALTTTVIAVVMIGVLLPFTPLAKPLGFVPMSLGFHFFLIAIVACYLLLTEFVKRRLLRGLNS
jgi:Mg2+-importing ATPase